MAIARLGGILISGVEFIADCLFEVQAYCCLRPVRRRLWSLLTVRCDSPKQIRDFIDDAEAFASSFSEGCGKILAIRT
jgi:hypothetical protein